MLYIHGFNSAPQSHKAQLTKAYFEAKSSEFEVHIAEFPPEPEKAIFTIKSLVSEIGEHCLAGFIGSSLGGYYSLYLHACFGKPSVLINPALRPYDLLEDYIGVNENMYTGERYEVTAEHMQQLRELDRSDLADASRLFLITQTGDEVLDYSDATTLLSRAKLWIDHGGDHAFVDYERVLPSIEHFFHNSL